MSLTSSPMHALTPIMANQLEQNPDVRTTAPPLTIHSWSKQRNDSPAPSSGDIVPSFMRDTLITRAAEQLSDTQLFVTTDNQPRIKGWQNPYGTKSDEPAQQCDEPVDRWAVRSPTTRHEPDRQIEPDVSAPDKHNDTAHKDNYSDDRDIRFGLSLHALFERADNHGAYREFSHHSADGTQREFEFRLDGNQHDGEPFGGYETNDGQSAGDDQSSDKITSDESQSIGNN